MPRGVFRTRLAESLSKDGDLPDVQDIRAFLSDADLLRPQGRAALEAKISKASGVPASQIFFYVPANAPGYKRAELWISEGAGRSKHQAGGDLTRRHLNLWEIWVFVASKDVAERAAVGDAADDATGLKNMIDNPEGAVRLV